MVGQENVFSLKQIQDWMQGVLVQSGPAELMGNVTVKDLINPSARLSAGAHLNIYRHSYIARLRECMRNMFAALSYALGEDLFTLFADQYLAAYPSHSYTLNHLGQNFAQFLQDTRPDLHEEQKVLWPDFMIELARFEYAISMIFDENTPNTYESATLESFDAQLILTPVFHLFKHPFALCQYYLDFVQKRGPELPFPLQTWCVVNRVNYKLGLFPINEAQYHLLTYLKEGKTLQEAQTQLMATFNFPKSDFDTVWSIWRTYFINSGFFVERE